MGPGWENKHVSETPCEAPGRHAAGRTGRRCPSGRAASPPQHLSSGARRQVPGCGEHCGLPVNDVAGRDGWIGWGHFLHDTDRKTLRGSSRWGL